MRDFSTIFLVAVAVTQVASVMHAPHASYRLAYEPLISSTPVTSTFLRESTNKAGQLYTISSANYSTPVQLIKLTGTPKAVGEAYGELLADDINAMYKAWYPTANPQLEAILDWLWDCSLKPQTPEALLEEIAGVVSDDIRSKMVRVMTGSTMPADTNNIAILVAREIKSHGAMGTHCVRTGNEVLASLGKLVETNTSTNVTGGLTHHCDFFGAWGKVTRDGRLLSTRNLDITPATGISHHKLIAVYNLDTNPVEHPYATVGYAGYFGSLAGMSSTQMTVSEANLDNAEVSFDGIAWPLRLRQILGTAQNLSHARAIWHSKNNTAAFNFLVGSGRDAAAVALETNSMYTSEFFGDSQIERAASYGCLNGTKMDGHPCTWPNTPTSNGVPLLIGDPLVNAVFRSNHALHPDVMKTQEPLWNDTVMRYMLLHDRIEDVSGVMDVREAVGIASLLGIKGDNYSSCEPTNFQTGDPTHVLSVVYDPSKQHMYVAYEDGDTRLGATADWRPAACQEYLFFNMSEWW